MKLNCFYLGFRSCEGYFTGSGRLFVLNHSTHRPAGCYGLLVFTHGFTFGSSAAIHVKSLRDLLVTGKYFLRLKKTNLKDLNYISQIVTITKPSSFKKNNPAGA
jgi:hypothetical protein